MIEIGIFQNGANPLAIKTLPSGTLVPDGNLAEVHEAIQRVVIGQVRQGILADELGFDGFYLTEHHFQIEGPENSCNPILVGTAIAARTKRIRLGQATNVFPQWHPVRLAEQAALLDVISGGRLDMGVGRGYQGREVEVLGGAMGATTQDQERNRAYFQECLEVIIKCWTELSFSHHGEFFSIPPSYTKWNHAQSQAYFSEQQVERTLEDIFKLGDPDEYGSGVNPVEKTTTILKEISVLPQPLQKPYPPLFMPTYSVRSADYAAQQGINAYSLVGAPSQTKALMERYYAKAEEFNWPDRMGDGTPWKYGWDAGRRRGVVYTRGLHCTDPSLSNKGSGARFLKGHEAQWDYYSPFGFVKVLTEIGEKPLEGGMKVTGEFLNERNIIVVGSKDEVIERLCGDREYLGLEDAHVMTWFDTNGFTTEETEEQMQFFAEEIAPVVRREFGGGVEQPQSSVDLDVSPARVA